MINIQTMLDEAKNTRWNPYAERPALKALLIRYGDEGMNEINKHWQNVDLGLTDEYKQMEEL